MHRDTHLICMKSRPLFYITCLSCMTVLMSVWASWYFLYHSQRSITSFGSRCSYALHINHPSTWAKWHLSLFQIVPNIRNFVYFVLYHKHTRVFGQCVERKCASNDVSIWFGGKSMSKKIVRHNLTRRLLTRDEISAGFVCIRRLNGMYQCLKNEKRSHVKYIFYQFFWMAKKKGSSGNMGPWMANSNIS